MKDDTEATTGSKDRGGSASFAAGGEALRARDAEGLACLWDYVKQHGTSQVPHRHKTTGGFLLGEWVTRRRKKRGEHSALDRLLESLPEWTWTPRKRGFEERLSRYKELAEADSLDRHRPLRAWAHAHRQLALKGEVSADRLKQLRDAGII
jgi:hypothetical protein